MKIQAINLNFTKSKIPNNKNIYQNFFLKLSFDTFIFTGKKGAKYFTPSELQEQKNRIKTVLEECANNGITISGNELSQKTGIAVHNIKKEYTKTKNFYLYGTKLKNMTMQDIAQKKKLS